MLTGNLLIVAAIAVVLGLLTILQFLLAARHDHAVSMAGPLQNLDALEVQRKQKQALLVDLDEDLRKRREALQNFAQIQADVDEMVRRRDELLTEWSSLEEKRAEVRVVRSDTERAVIDRHSVEAELVRSRAELDEIRDRLAKAEQLLAQTGVLEAELDGLTQRIEELRDQRRLLEEAEERTTRLDLRAQELDTAIVRSHAQLAERSAELEETQARLTAERQALAGTQTERAGIVAETAAVAIELRQSRAQLQDLADQRVTLEVQIATLNEGIRKAGGQPDGLDEKKDPLRELTAVPPVLQELRKWPASGVIAEIDALDRVHKWLEKSGLHFHPRVIRSFHTAMKVNETTQIAVLAGISGTGKSQLPRLYAAAMGIGFLQVPVQPRWDSPQDLMGFYNYIEGRFRPTDMARALWHLDGQHDSTFNDRMMLVLLDEMNLARVEYYFSDFLSRLESRPPKERVGDANLRKDAEIELEIPMSEGQTAPRVFPGYNLLFAGTMNEDESTQSLSDKVVDRANVMRFTAPTKISHAGISGILPAPEALPRAKWDAWVKPTRQVDQHPQVAQSVERMRALMQNFKRPFGHRLGRAIMAYVANYPQGEGIESINEALADQVEMRLLPKLRGVEVANLEAAFGELQTFVEGNLRDHALAYAIKASVDAAREGAGQFVWQGLGR
jgi:septal ring factor EnvC (AmiA/AmiB activator)